MDAIKLERIESERKITCESDSEFLHEYQKAVLLALLESGRLTEMQYRYAEEKLWQQHSAHLSNGA